jgi:hypothetical protein
MKALLSIGEFKDIQLSPEIQIVDVMDGTPDTLTVSFIYPEDITSKLKLKDEATVSIEDELHTYTKIGEIDLDREFTEYKGYILIGDEEYFINLNGIYQWGKLVGSINYENKSLFINGEPYVYDEDNNVWSDKRKYYNMCLSQITSQLNSTVANNGYQITLSLKEQTVYLKDCIRSDLAISPSLYPQIPTSIKTFTNIFEFEDNTIPPAYDGIEVKFRGNEITLDGKNTIQLHTLVAQLKNPISPGTYNYDEIIGDVNFDFVKINTDTNQIEYEVNSWEYEGSGQMIFEQEITHIVITISLFEEFKNSIIKWNIYSEDTVNYIDGSEEIYPTLLEATYKVCDRHNMVLLNKKITSLDNELIEALSKVSCPNLTYKDLSTYDQLYDIFMRIGRVPYFEKGKLSGIKLTGSKKNIENNFNMLTYSETNNGVTIKTEGNTIILNGKSDISFDFKLPLAKAIVGGTYNIVFIDRDFDVAFFPAIYFMNYPQIGIYTENVSEDYTLSFPYDVDMRSIKISIDAGRTYENDKLTMYILSGDEINIEFSDILKGTSISSLKEEGVNQNIYSTKVYNNLYDEEKAVVPSIFTATLNAPFVKVSSIKKGDSSETYINQWFNRELREWTWLDSPDQIDAKALLSVSNFNSDSYNIEDVRNYGLTLPSNIERIINVYKISPFVLYEDSTDEVSFGFWKVPVGCKLLEKGKDPLNIQNDGTFSVSNLGNIQYSVFCDEFGNNGKVMFNDVYYDVVNFEFTINNRKFTILENSRLIEYKYWSELSSLQQAEFAYYESGSNQIKRLICMVSNDLNYLPNSFSWSEQKLFDELKQWFYVVVYKPMLDQPYINYEYNLVSNGKENKPFDVNTYNLPYKSVTDKQVYPLLEYNLEKGTDTSHQLKIITKNPILLNYTASDIILIDGKPYIINQMDMQINDRSIEATLVLSDNIAINSILSEFRDSIRVSSNLSTETTVTASIPILSEQVIFIDDKPSSNVLTEEAKMTADNDYFTQQIGKYMSTQTMYDLGMPLSEYGEYYKDVYRYLLKYPIRFSKIINKNAINNVSDYKYRIDIHTQYPVETSVFEFNSFPIYARRRQYTIFGTGDFYGDTITINSYEDLERLNDSEFKLYVCYAELPTVLNAQRVTKDIKGGNVSWGTFTDWTHEFIDHYVWYDFSRDGENWTQLRPEMWKSERNGEAEISSVLHRYSTKQGWTKILNKFNIADADLSPAKRPYSIYASGLDTYHVYATEGIISQSGDLTSYTYMLSNPTFLNNRYTTTTTDEEIIKLALKNPNTVYRSVSEFSKTDPAYYNKSDSGCIIEGFGAEYNDIYGLGILNSYTPSNYGLIMDLREIPQLYLQFKTMVLNSDVVEIKELNKNIKYLQTKVPYDTETDNDTYFLIQIPKQMSLNDFVYDKDTIDNYRVVDQQDELNNFISLFHLGIGTFNMYGSKLRRNNNYDYVLLQTNASNGDSFEDATFVRPIVKFNIIGENEIENIVFHMEIRNSYDGITHNKYTTGVGKDITEVNIDTSTTLNLGKVEGLYDMSKTISGFKSILSIRITEDKLIGEINGEDITVEIDTVNIGKLFSSREEVILTSVDNEDIKYSVRLSTNQNNELLVTITRNVPGIIKKIFVVADSIYEEV